MKKLWFWVLLIIATHALNAEPVRDLINSGQSQTLGSQKYNLTWSYNSSQGYYKQEYVKEGESPDSFKNLFTIDILRGENNIKAALTQKAKEIEDRKKFDPISNWNAMERGGQYILDFVLSDGKSTIEWNIYYYSLKDVDSIPSLCLTAYSKRIQPNSDQDVKIFFQDIVQDRDQVIEDIIATTNSIGSLSTKR